MLEYNTRVQAIQKDSDLSEQHHDVTIGSLSYLLKSIPDMPGTVFYVRDRDGWTQIHRAWHIMDPTPSPSTFMAIEFYNAYKVEQLVVKGGCLVPTYNSGNTKVGFHGSIQYEYELKYAGELSAGDKIRVAGCDDVVPILSMHDVPYVCRSLDPNMLSGNYSYTLGTKSGWFNANGVLVYGGVYNEKKLPARKGLN